MSLGNDQILKVYKNFRVVDSWPLSELVSCIAQCKKSIFAAGCQSGNIIMIDLEEITFKTCEQAHQNLIRCIVPMQRYYNGNYFVSADVCGFLKVWATKSKAI